MKSIKRVEILEDLRTELTRSFEQDTYCPTGLCKTLDYSLRESRIATERSGRQKNNIHSEVKRFLHKRFAVSKDVQYNNVYWWIPIHKSKEGYFQRLAFLNKVIAQEKQSLRYIFEVLIKNLF